VIGRCLLALAGALALTGCGAQEQKWPPPSPALWEVTGGDGAKGWLFGTIHALPEGAGWDTATLDAALGQSGVLVVEIANLKDPHAAAVAYGEAATATDLPPLLQRVPPQDRPELAAALERVGFDDADFRYTDSWAVALDLANAARSGEFANGVDRGLLGRGLPTIGLERFADQFTMMDRLAPDDQAVLLMEAARDSTEAAKRALVEAWLTGDLAALERKMQGGMLTDPELRQALLVARNQAWAARIAGLLAQRRRPFVAVGAAHMLGGDGLPALLAARGYTVRRIQ